MLKIETGVPVPPRCRNGGRTTVYPLNEMEVNDSFFISYPTKKKALTAAKMLNGLIWQRRKNCLKLANTKFTIRAMDNGVRCWRVA